MGVDGKATIEPWAAFLVGYTW